MRTYGFLGITMLAAMVCLSGCALSNTRAETVGETGSPVVLSGRGVEENTGGPGVQRQEDSTGAEAAGAEQETTAAEQETASRRGTDHCGRVSGRGGRRIVCRA